MDWRRAHNCSSRCRQRAVFQGLSVVEVGAGVGFLRECIPFF
jgi:hypothetical protein